MQLDLEIILGCFPALSDEQVVAVMDEWAKETYPDTPLGHTKAEADLMQMLRWESMSPQQREEEAERLHKGR